MVLIAGIVSDTIALSHFFFVKRAEMPRFKVEESMRIGQFRHESWWYLIGIGQN